MKKLKKPKDGNSINKFGDTTKTSKDRLHAFLQAYKGKDGKLEDSSCDSTFIGTFIRENCADLIYLIYEAFWQYLDHGQNKKSKKSGTEESDLLEVILPTLEKVLQYLPDKINELWHYHGIATMLKEILSPNNNLAPNNTKDLRKKGIKLTILWILGLLDKHDTVAVEVFNCILPELLHQLIPNQNHEPEGSSDTTVLSLFQYLLENLTCNLLNIYWPDETLVEETLRKKQIEGFRTVFNLCKSVYFNHIFDIDKRKTPLSTLRGLDPQRHSISSSVSLHSRTSATLPGQHRVERLHSNTSSHKSDLDTPTSHGRDQEDDDPEILCLKCGSASHATERCVICDKCKSIAHRTRDCPQTIIAEVETHHTRYNNLVQRQVLELHDEIMKWFVQQAKNILPHAQNRCPFVNYTDDDVRVDKENYADQVEICMIVDRVLFADRENVNLMSEAFSKGPIVLQQLKEDKINELMSDDETQEFNFSKMLTLYYDLILNIKEYNAVGMCPEFLSDSKPRKRQTNYKRRIKSFLKSATLNIAPLLRYPESHMKFSTKTKKNIERVAYLTCAFYLVVIQQIDQADESVCFRIIICLIKSIEHNWQKGIPLNSYRSQLEHLLDAVRFVGRKVVLPEETWLLLRRLLLKLETDLTANDIWNELIETMTQEISVHVYSVGLNKSSRDEKAPKAKGRLPGQTEEKTHLAYMHMGLKNALNKLHMLRREKPHHHQKNKDQPDKTQKPIDVYHYHGLNEIFIKSTRETNDKNERSDNPNSHWEEDEVYDELRENKGEHPIVLWRRFLTLKGNPNRYKTGDLHRKMFESLSNILDLLLWIDDNKDTQERTVGKKYKYLVSVPEHPVYTYVYHILPWFFEAFMKNPALEFLPGKKEAMRMLCKCLIRLNPIKPPVPLLHLFYNILLNCLRREHLRLIETRSICQNGGRSSARVPLHEKPNHELLFQVVKGTKHLFSINLTGCQIGELINSLSQGAMSVLEPGLASGPKSEAIILLGSLYTYPWTEPLLKQQIVAKIKHVARAETDQFNRSRAIGMIGYIILTMLSKRKGRKSERSSPESPTQIMNKIETTFTNDMISTRSYDSLNERADSMNLIDLINIVLLQVRSINSQVALSALAVIRDMSESMDALLDCDNGLPRNIIESLLAALGEHMEMLRKPAEDFDAQSMKSSPSGLYDPLSNSQTSFQYQKFTPSRDVIKSYQEAVVYHTIWTLVEWVLNLPDDLHNTRSNGVHHSSGIPLLGGNRLHRPLQETVYAELLKKVFKVLQLTALDRPFGEHVALFREAQRKLINEYKITDIKEGDVNVETMPQVDSSLPYIPGAQDTNDNIKSCAELALFVICQRYHQFPLCGGPDYSSSMVYEYNPNDCRKQADRGREMNLFTPKTDLQMLMMDDSIVVSLVEFAKIPKEVEDTFDLPFDFQRGYGRVIFRNVAGRFSWLSKRLFGLKEPPYSPPAPLDLIDHTSDVPELEQYPTLTAPRDFSRAEGPPSCDNTDPNNQRDLLFQTIDYIKGSSDEISFYREKKLPYKEEDFFSKVSSMLENQKTNEENADSSLTCDTPDNSPMRSDVSNMFTAESPFQQCRGIASSLSLLSWNKRSSYSGRQVELIEHNSEHMKPALEQFDFVPNREIQKFGLVYIARGQERRDEILRNNVGSKDFEEFVAGLGWELGWQDLQGFHPTIGKDCAAGSTIHYATPSLETVFHVSTRLNPGTQEPSLYRFKYIGNDYVIVIWSEHDRDVNRDIFKSSYLDIVIVIYPMKELEKYRVQIIVKGKTKIEPSIGPLFDGALVERNLLPELVRKTCINAGRLIAVDQARPTVYIERVRSRDKLKKYKRQTTFEELACEVMSPSIYDFSQYKDYHKSQVVESKNAIQRSTSKIKHSRNTARQSTGYSSQDNMSESERSKAEKKSHKWPRREASDSDTKR